MPMKLKAQLMDDVTVKRALARLSYEIIEKSRDLENVVLIGIKTRGVPIAEQIAANIETHTGVKVQTCTLDITFYRDDLTKRHDLPTVNTQTLPVDLNDKEVILVDDVLFTGRTVRAAIDAVFRFGRPARRIGTMVKSSASTGVMIFCSGAWISTSFVLSSLSVS